MTKTQKEMLREIAAGSDPNMIAQVAHVMGARAASNASRTLLALFKQGMLKRGNGLEISDLGRVTAAKQAKAQTPTAQARSLSRTGGTGGSA
jgi:hypothetical protein